MTVSNAHNHKQKALSTCILVSKYVTWCILVNTKDNVQRRRECISHNTTNTWAACHHSHQNIISTNRLLNLCPQSAKFLLTRLSSAMSGILIWFLHGYVFRGYIFVVQKWLPVSNTGPQGLNLAFLEYIWKFLSWVRTSFAMCHKSGFVERMCLIHTCISLRAFGKFNSIIKKPFNYATRGNFVVVNHRCNLAILFLKVFVSEYLGKGKPVFRETHILRFWPRSFDQLHTDTVV